MELHELKGLLMSHAEAVMQLAEKLDKDGVKLKAYELQLIRTAMVPAVTECMDLMKSSFIAGNEKWLYDEMKRLNQYIEIAM